MGLGKLNPGCGCECIEPPVPRNECQRAAKFVRPISMTISGPLPITGTGIYLSPHQTDPFQYPPSQECGTVGGAGEPTSYTYMFPHWSEEVFCGNSLGLQFCISQSFSNWAHPVYYRYAMWPIATIGNCEFVHNNSIIQGGYWNTAGLRPGHAVQYGCYFGFSLIPNTDKFFMSVSVGCSFQLGARGVGGICSFPDIPYPGFNGIVPPGANYVKTIDQFGKMEFKEISASPAYSSVARTSSGWDGNQFTAMCPWPYRQYNMGGMSSSSTWNFASDHPAYGSKRSFTLWKPSPAIEPLGLLSKSVTCTIKLGIDGNSGVDG